MLHDELSTKTPGTQARLSEPDSCAHGPRRAHCFHTRCALRNEDPNHRRDGGVSSFFFDFWWCQDCSVSLCFFWFEDPMVVSWWFQVSEFFHDLTWSNMFCFTSYRIIFLFNIIVPIGSMYAIYGAPWIPSIYPSNVSIPAPWILWGIESDSLFTIIKMM